MASVFEQCATDDIVALIDEYPLAWVVALGRGGGATPLPMILDLDDDARPISLTGHLPKAHPIAATLAADPRALFLRSEEHTSELQSLMRISYAVFCLKKKNEHKRQNRPTRRCNVN